MFPTDMSHVDSGNYTCDVSGPGAELLDTESTEEKKRDSNSVYVQRSVSYLSL